MIVSAQQKCIKLVLVYKYAFYSKMMTGFHKANFFIVCKCLPGGGGGGGGGVGGKILLIAKCPAPGTHCVSNTWGEVLTAGINLQMT